MLGSEPLAGTITERPTGITFEGGAPCRADRRPRERPRERNDSPDLHEEEPIDRYAPCDGPRRDPPRHLHHGRRSEERRLLHPRPRAAAPEEDGEHRAPD